MSAGDSGLFKAYLERKIRAASSKPGRDTLHAVPLDIAAIPHGEGNGTVTPGLNCTSLGSLVAKVRLTTMRQVGPTQQPPLIEPAGSHRPFPITS